MAIKQFEQTGQWLVLDDDNRIIQIHDSKEDADSEDFHYNDGDFVVCHEVRFKLGAAIITGESTQGIIRNRGRYGPTASGSPYYEVDCGGLVTRFFPQKYITKDGCSLTLKE